MGLGLGLGLALLLEPPLQDGEAGEGLARAGRPLDEGERPAWVGGGEVGPAL